MAGHHWGETNERRISTIHFSALAGAAGPISGGSLPGRRPVRTADATGGHSPTEARLREQCLREVSLASLIRNAPTRGDRIRLYGQVYGAYAVEFPESLSENDDTARIASYEERFIRRFVHNGSIVAEIGPGRCELSFRLARHVRHVHGVDVCEAVAAHDEYPGNFTLKITDGISVPLDDSSVDVVVSKELMEHLHPDDALYQLREIRRVLRPGGIYICVTPNRLTGPHDCSREYYRFGGDSVLHEVAVGLHLKEYTTVELIDVFQSAGFRNCVAYSGSRGLYVPMPRSVVLGLEKFIRRLPPEERAHHRFLRALAGIRLVARGAR